MQNGPLTSVRKLKNLEMKSIYTRLLNTMVLTLIALAVANAQYDDIYFDPSDAEESYAAVEEAKLVKSYGGEEATASEDDYDHYYASRIRRFDTPYYGFDYYSPIYVDPYYYDANYANFYQPGVNIYNSPTANWNSPGSPAFAGGTYTSVNSVWNNPSYGYGGATTGISTGIYSGGASSFGGSVGGFGAGSTAGFAGSGISGGGYNPYCPPASVGVYNGRPIVNTNPTATPTGGSTRGTSAIPSTYYGPRGTGTVNASPRNSPRGNTSGTSAPDRPFAAAGNTGTPTSVSRPNTALSPREGAATIGTIRNSPNYVPRSDRPSYTPPSAIANRGVATSRSARSSTRFSAPSRPTAGSSRVVSPSNRSYRSPASSTRSYRPTSSTRSSSPRMSSPRMSSSPRSSSGGAMRSSGGGSPRRN